MQRRAGDGGDRLVFVRFQRDLELAFFFAAVDREHAVALQAAHRLRKVVVHGVDGVVLVCADGFEHAGAVQQRAQASTQVCIVRQILRDDVARARERILGGLHTLFRVDIGLCQRFKCRGGGARRENGRCKRLQPLFARDGRTGAPLGTVGAVQVVERGERLCLLNGSSQFVRQLALCIDRISHLGAALVQPAQIGKPVGQLADGLVVHRAVHFLAVARDKRHGVAVVEQLDHVFHIVFLLPELAGKDLNDRFHKTLLCSQDYCTTFPARGKRKPARKNVRVCSQFRFRYSSGNGRPCSSSSVRWSSTKPMHR